MSGIPTSSLTRPIPGRVFENQGPMRPAWDELRMNPNRPISWNDRFGTDSMIGTSQSNADRPMELDLRSRPRSVSGSDPPKAITVPHRHCCPLYLQEQRTYRVSFEAHSYDAP